MKEREKFENNNVFEGIVSFRTVVSSILEGKNTRKILKVFYDGDKVKNKIKEFSYIKAKSYELNFEIDLVSKDVIEEMSVGNSHGGLVFVCSDKSFPEISSDEIVNNGFYMMLDGIEDPYNFGYSLRSLYAAGVNGIILPKRNWMGAAGVVCRASAGASELIPLYVAEDDAWISSFKEKGYTVACADIENSVSVYEADLKKPLLLIVGGEKRGISKPLLDSADTIVRIDYGRDFPSALSAASASAVLAFEVFRQNR
ncbi:MAG: RNA methyltransferase [Clostridia bacterium]|nr:RNA methyltransferase [Clostridia bacterium]